MIGNILNKGLKPTFNQTKNKLVFVNQTRSKSYFPPNVSSLKELGTLDDPAAHPLKLKKLQTLYQNLPKKTEWRTLSYDEKKDQLTLIQKYNAKYFEQDSLVPIFHGMIGLIALYYYIQYGQGPVSISFDLIYILFSHFLLKFIFIPHLHSLISLSLLTYTYFLISVSFFKKIPSY